MPLLDRLVVAAAVHVEEGGLQREFGQPQRGQCEQAQRAVGEFALGAGTRVARALVDRAPVGVLDLARAGAGGERHRSVEVAHGWLLALVTRIRYVFEGLVVKPE